MSFTSSTLMRLATRDRSIEVRLKASVGGELGMSTDHSWMTGGDPSLSYAWSNINWQHEDIAVLANVQLPNYCYVNVLTGKSGQ
jgi:hypothetical protein